MPATSSLSMGIRRRRRGLALTTDGMILAALVVIWIRRHRLEPVKAGPWAAFWAGVAATIAAKLAAAQPSPVGIVVALWSRVCLAITLEGIALVASLPKHRPIITDTLPAGWTAQVPDDAQPAPGRVPAEPAGKDRASRTREAGHGSGTGNGRLVGEMPAEPVDGCRLFVVAKIRAPVAIRGNQLGSPTSPPANHRCPKRPQHAHARGCAKPAAGGVNTAGVGDNQISS